MDEGFCKVTRKKWIARRSLQYHPKTNTTQGFLLFRENDSPEDNKAFIQ